MVENDTATGRKGTIPGSTTLQFDGGPFDGQVWSGVCPGDFGPTADRGCIVIRDDHPDGWPLYASDAGTFDEDVVTLKFKGWD